jgi:hypothetical protein
LAPATNPPAKDGVADHLWARLLDGDHAHRTLQNTFRTSPVMGSNIDWWEEAVDRICSIIYIRRSRSTAISAHTAGIEMLLQSQAGEISPAPALPKVASGFGHRAEKARQRHRGRISFGKAKA